MGVLLNGSRAREGEERRSGVGVYRTDRVFRKSRSGVECIPSGRHTGGREIALRLPLLQPYNLGNLGSELTLGIVEGSQLVSGVVFLDLVFPSIKNAGDHLLIATGNTNSANADYG